MLRTRILKGREGTETSSRKYGTEKRAILLGTRKTKLQWQEQTQGQKEAPQGSSSQGTAPAKVKASKSRMQNGAMSRKRTNLFITVLLDHTHGSRVIGYFAVTITYCFRQASQ